MSPRSRRDGEAGFTLIEALVALAIVAVMLSAIGGVIATSVKGTRAIDQRLELSGAAETLLAELPARNLLKTGRQTGETGGVRWRIDVSPMPAVTRDLPPDARWTPLAVALQLQGPGGAAMRVTTVRLVPRGGQ